MTIVAAPIANRIVQSRLEVAQPILDYANFGADAYTARCLDPGEPIEDTRLAQPDSQSMKLTTG